MAPFDPYHKWLGIPETARPVSKYRLLAIEDFEADRDVISAAAEQRTIYLRTMQSGEHTVLVAELLNEVSQARVTLLNADQKAAYDAELREQQVPEPEAEPAPTPVIQTPAPTPVVVRGTVTQEFPVSVVQPAKRPRRRKRKQIWKRPVVIGVSLVGVIAALALMMFSGDAEPVASNVPPVVTSPLMPSPVPVPEPQTDPVPHPVTPPTLPPQPEAEPEPETGFEPTVRTLVGHTDKVMSVVFSPDGETILSGSLDKTLKLWQTRTGALLRTLTGHTDVVYSGTFNPDGKTLASGSRDKTIKLWRASTGDEVMTLEVHTGAMSVAFSPDGKTIASGSTGDTVQLLLFGSEISRGIVVPPANPRLSILNGHSSDVRSVAFSPDGKTIASGSDDATIKLWNSQTGKVIKTIATHSNQVASVEFSPDGKLIASGCADHSIRIWEAKTGQEISKLTGHTDKVMSVVFSPNGQTIVSGSRDTKIKFWDIVTGIETQTLLGHKYAVLEVALSTDGSQLASASGDGTIKLWDIDTGAESSPIPTAPAAESITNTFGMTFNKIPAGTFMMGSPEGEVARQNDEHQHKVTITKPFYMQTTEVTQEQWKALMGTEPWKGEDFVKEGPNYAATYVSWNDAVAYCEKLSEKEGKTYRLPTEAEWEYACRAETTTTWSFGDDEKALGDYAWYRENTKDVGERYAHQVGLKKPNAFGLYDMHGNVWEWCHDYYGEVYYKQSPEQEPAPDSSRVLRGGSWGSSMRATRSDFNLRNDANYGHYVGFRVVRELD